mmetsp:Transcript_1993/g.2678  ORF Transcript_1993/g.2678 Transcript_1993/m.2678 type:complete len:451 (-) Transcript_1993:1012-2364(-)
MTKSKAARHAHAPRRNISPYLHFQNANRETFKAQNPGKTFGEVCKYTSSMYAKLTEQEKEHWTRKAQEDKSRYIVELATYIPPDGYDSRGDSMSSSLAAASSTASMSTTSHPQDGSTNNSNKTTTRQQQQQNQQQHIPSSSKSRDPKAPRRNCSAFVMYSAQKMRELKQTHADLPTTNLFQVISEAYKALSEQDRASWQARAMQDKVRYDTEAALYDPKGGARDKRGVLLSDMKGSKRKSRKEKRDPDAPKRASGAYVFFTNAIRSSVVKEKPGLSFVEMGRELGERWRALEPEERKKYEKMALDDKVRFQRDMVVYNAGLLQHPASSSRIPSASIPGSEDTSSQADETDSQTDVIVLEEDTKPAATTTITLHDGVKASPLVKPNPLHSFGAGGVEDDEESSSTASKMMMMEQDEVIIMPPPASVIMPRAATAGKSGEEASTDTSASSTG